MTTTTGIGGLPAPSVTREGYSSGDDAGGGYGDSGGYGDVSTFDFGIPQPPAPTRIRQGGVGNDYSNTGWSQNLQDFFNQQQPADNGSWSYDIANKTFGKGGGRPGAGNQQSWYSDIPQDVMSQYVDSQKAQNDAYQNYFTNNPSPLLNENGPPNFGDFKPPEITDISKYFHQSGDIQTPTPQQPETTEGETGLPAPTQTATQTPLTQAGMLSSLPNQTPKSYTNPSDFEGLNFASSDTAFGGANWKQMPMFHYAPGTSIEQQLRHEAPYMTRDNYEKQLNYIRERQTPTTTGIGGLPAPDLTQPSTGQTTTQPANTVPGMNFNPATNSYNPIPSTVPATNLGALASVAGVAAAVTKGNPMANLLQGSALPNITTTQTASTTAPDWYNQFLSGLSTSGQAAVNTGGIAGASGLQTAAYNAAPTAINAGLPTLDQAKDVATGAAGAPDINQFMNPYMTGVVDEIGRLGQKNFTDILAPNAVAGAAGSGQFGSRRGMEVYGDVARDSARATTGQQATALQSGYQNAVQAALQRQQNQTQAGNLLGTLSGQEYTQGIGGLDVLSRLGAQQQATSQAALNYPMTAQQNYANLLRGFTVPTTQSQTFTGPIPGAYSNSPLSQIAGLGLSTAGIFANKIDPKTGLEIKGTSVFDTLKNLAGFGAKTGDPTGNPTNNNVDGITYTPEGAVVNSGITYNSDGSYTLSDGTTVNPSEYSETYGDTGD